MQKKKNGCIIKIIIELIQKQFVGINHKKKFVFLQKIKNYGKNAQRLW